MKLRYVAAALSLAVMGASVYYFRRLRKKVGTWSKNSLESKETKGEKHIRGIMRKSKNGDLTFVSKEI